MVSGFLDRLPSIILELVVFAIFFVVGRVVRNLIRKFSERNKQHYNLGLVLGRLAQTEATDGDRAAQREGWPKGKGDAPKTMKISDVLRANRDASE